MICNNCGQEIADGSQYCEYCGQAVKTGYTENQQMYNTTENGGQYINQQQYGGQYINQQSPYPPMQARMLKTNRGMLKTILLSLITCGIYALVFYSSLGEDINQIASRRDGKKTMHYCLLLFIIAPLTCGIALFVWFHNISGRIGEEARMRGIDTSFGASTFWLWEILGAIIIVGPFVYLYKLCKTMNDICENYNTYGY